MFYIVQTTTATRKEAKELTQMLFEKGLIACAKLNKVESSYVWERKFCQQKEFKLEFITTQKQIKAVQKALLVKHSYEVPEFVVFELKYASENYGKWVKESIKG